MKLIVPYVAMLLCTIFWGANMVVYRVVELDPDIMVFFRFAPAVPLFFLLLWWKERSIGISWRALTILAIASGLGVTALEFAVIYSSKWTTLANATMLNVAPWPIFTALFAALYLKEKLTKNLIIGGLAAIVGVTLIIMLSGGQQSADATNPVAGNLVAFLASIAGALFNVLCIPLMKEYSPLRVSAWSIGLGSLFMIPFTITSWDDVAWSEFGLVQVGGIAYNVMLCTFLAFLVWNAAMLKVGATRANFIRYGVPATGMIMGIIFYNESITFWQLIGSLLLLAGLVYISIERTDSGTPSHS